MQNVNYFFEMIFIKHFNILEDLFVLSKVVYE